MKLERNQTTLCCQQCRSSQTFHSGKLSLSLSLYLDTSRTKKDSEINGQDYHFISRTQFEADIVNRRFVEHGEYEKSYYGTTLDAIRTVVSAGKFCVLNLHPQSLKILKESNLMPFVVFVAPPSLEKLRAKKRDKGETVKVNLPQLPKR
jgi:MAGUK p55 subfamily protein 5